MKKKFFLVLFFTYCILMFGTEQTVKIEMEILFCDLTFPETYKKINASFNIHVLFEIDDKGLPKNIKIVDPTRRVVDLEEIKNCMNQWIIKGFSTGTRLSAIWYWKHAEGWQYLKIIGPCFEQTIKAKAIKRLE